MNYKKDIIRLIIPEGSMTTKAVIDTLLTRNMSKLEDRPRLASNILTDIAALVLWEYLEREGSIEAEILSVTDKVHIEPFDTYDTEPYQFSKERVDAFVDKLCGPLGTSVNDESIQVHSRDSDALQFIYCLLESHASVASSHVRKMIEEFERLSFWEMSNVLYYLQDVIEQRLKSASKYYANLARFAEKSKE